MFNRFPKIHTLHNIRNRDILYKPNKAAGIYNCVRNIKSMVGDDAGGKEAHVPSSIPGHLNIALSSETRIPRSMNQKEDDKYQEVYF